MNMAAKKIVGSILQVSTKIYVQRLRNNFLSAENENADLAVFPVLLSCQRRCIFEGRCYSPRTMSEGEFDHLTWVLMKYTMMFMMSLIFGALGTALLIITVIAALVNGWQEPSWAVPVGSVIGSLGVLLAHYTIRWFRSG